MMNLDEPVMLHLLLLSNALLAGVAAFALLRCERLLERLSGDAGSREHTPAAIVQDDTEVQAVEECLPDLQQPPGDLAQKEQALKRRHGPESQYENAVRMIRSGADADDLTRTCGLNKGAAQLMVRLHGVKGV
jgi:hypothetical protein